MGAWYSARVINMNKIVEEYPEVRPTYQKFNNYILKYSLDTAFKDGFIDDDELTELVSDVDEETPVEDIVDRIITAHGALLAEFRQATGLGLGLWYVDETRDGNVDIENRLLWFIVDGYIEKTEAGKAFDEKCTPPQLLQWSD